MAKNEFSENSPRGNREKRESRERRFREKSGELHGDDFYYGGPRSQRQDWDRRAWDYGDRDRGEGMYEAGGSDFTELMDEGYPAPDSLVRGERTRFTGGDRGWGDRRHKFMVDVKNGVKNFFGVGPKGYKRSDERIQEEVCEALAGHPDVDASEIEVRVTDGEVVLTGTVDSRWMKRQAEDAVAFVPGVRDVRVELTIPRNTDDTGEVNRKFRSKKAS